MNSGMIMRKIILCSVISVWLLIFFSAGTAVAITSDDFNSLTLNESLWEKVDILNDSTFIIMGKDTPDALLSISVPAGRPHDVWTGGNNAPRIMQNLSDTDFEIEVKFQSLVSQQYQMQGIIIEQDDGNFLRFDFYSDGLNIHIFAANFTAASPIVVVDTIISPSPGAVPMYMSVKRVEDRWTLNYSYNGINWINAANFNYVLTVTSAGSFAGNAGSSPSFTCLIDYFFNSSSRIVPEDVVETTPPAIDLWNGNSQKFGQLGVPQKWVNILGNVHDNSGVASLNYSLNDGSVSDLSIGPESYYGSFRLASIGDFNIEIDRADLLCGDNYVDINAIDSAGNIKKEIVSINYSCNNAWPVNYNINWSNVTNIQEVAQIVDGIWTKETNSVHPKIIGYDRLIAIGNMTWKDYEITVPITLNEALDPNAPHSGPNFGVALRWQGHYDSSSSQQPRDFWYPLGALGVYIWAPEINAFRLRIIGNGMYLIADDNSGKQLGVGVPYMFKMRAKTINATTTLYSLKVWEQNTDEPSAWTISGYGGYGELKQGSALLNTHYSNVSYGNVTVRSGPFVPEDIQPGLNISGYKINDNNGDGKWNMGEKGIANWTISLINDKTGFEITNTTTNNFGFYRFENLSNGIYNVTEEARYGFIATNSTFLRITLLGTDAINQNFTNMQIQRVKAKIKIKPGSLNLASKEEFTADITLPYPFDEKNIKLSTLICNGAYAFKGKASDEGSFIAKFKIQDLNDMPAAKEVSLKVTGKINFNSVLIDFEGNDTIKVIKNRKEAKKNREPGR